MNKQLTVQDLYRFCEQEIKKGNSKRLIVISDDNEGNGFHGLFYAFTEIDEKDKEYYPIYDFFDVDFAGVLPKEDIRAIDIMRSKEILAKETESEDQEVVC